MYLVFYFQTFECKAEPHFILKHDEKFGKMTETFIHFILYFTVKTNVYQNLIKLVF